MLINDEDVDDGIRALLQDHEIIGLQKFELWVLTRLTFQEIDTTECYAALALLQSYRVCSSDYTPTPGVTGSWYATRTKLIGGLLKLNKTKEAKKQLRKMHSQLKKTYTETMK